MISAAEKKLILVGSAAVVALSAVCTGILIAVSGDKPTADEKTVVEEPRGEFPMRYFQKDRHNYISADGNLAVIGPAMEKVRLENGKKLYPIVVLHKHGESFAEPYILWCELVSESETENIVLVCENVRLEERLPDVDFTYSDGSDMISVKLRLVGEEE